MRPCCRNGAFHGLPPSFDEDIAVVRDAVADYSDEMMHAALEINLPNYASAIVTAKEVVDALSPAGAAV